MIHGPVRGPSNNWSSGPVCESLQRVSIDIITEDGFEVINLERDEFQYNENTQVRVSTDHYLFEFII